MAPADRSADAETQQHFASVERSLKATSDVLGSAITSLNASLKALLPRERIAKGTCSTESCCPDANSIGSVVTRTPLPDPGCDGRLQLCALEHSSKRVLSYVFYSRWTWGGRHTHTAQAVLAAEMV